MRKLIYFVASVLLINTGCTSSKITSSWKTQDIPTYGINKVLVLGLIRDSDSTIQEKMENHFVGDLLDLGYNAVSSLQEYGKKAFDGIDEETALDMLKKKGVDAVMTIVLLDKSKETKYVPEAIGYSPHVPYFLTLTVQRIEFVPNKSIWECRLHKNYFPRNIYCL